MASCSIALEARLNRGRVFRGRLATLEHHRVLACCPSSRLAPTSPRNAMNPAVAAAAWITGALIETSKIRDPSAHRQSSPVSGQGSPGSLYFQRQAHRPENLNFIVIDLLVRHAEQEQQLFLCEEAGYRVLARRHAFDKPFTHWHGQRGRLDHAFITGVGLKLEPAVLPPRRRH